MSESSEENVSIISAFDSSQNALNNTEIGIFLFLSIFTLITPLFSVSISNQEPFAGMIFKVTPLSETLKKTQVDLII